MSIKIKRCNVKKKKRKRKKRKRKEKEKRKKYLSPSHRVSFFGDHVGCCPGRRCEGVGRVDQTASWFRYAEVRAATSSTKPVLFCCLSNKKQTDFTRKTTQ